MRTANEPYLWDVASLTKLISILGIRNREDPEFWDFYINWGHIRENFTALETIKHSREGWSAIDILHKTFSLSRGTTQQV